MTLIVLNLFGIATVAALLPRFPFDFSVIPNTTVAGILPLVVTVVLVAVLIELSIGTLVSFIKLIVNIARGTPEY